MLDRRLVYWLCPSSSFSPASKVVVIVVYLFVFSRDSVVKCTCDAVLGRGVGGHITLCISRAGVEVIALVLPLVGAVGIRKRKFLYLGRKRFIFNILKHVPLVLMKAKQLGRFLRVAGDWILLIWIASLLLSARRWWKRLNIWKLVVLPHFRNFLMAQLVGRWIRMVV